MTTTTTAFHMLPALCGHDAAKHAHTLLSIDFVFVLMLLLLRLAAIPVPDSHPADRLMMMVITETAKKKSQPEGMMRWRPWRRRRWILLSYTRCSLFITDLHLKSRDVLLNKPASRNALAGATPSQAFMEIGLIKFPFALLSISCHAWPY
jgi:hypothetical protein